ncbi:MAG: hypothetical protein ACR2PL_02830 [Dehalococcoidia bacterium]
MNHKAIPSNLSRIDDPPVAGVMRKRKEETRFGEQAERPPPIGSPSLASWGHRSPQQSEPNINQTELFRRALVIALRLLPFAKASERADTFATLVCFVCSARQTVTFLTGRFSHLRRPGIFPVSKHAEPSAEGYSVAYDAED